ncbi:LysM domain-containing protein [Paenibacillaceae bacterium GAS479]|nr:LysM domain-containing protein [Paenibacillaceae bacterium GAS479]
MTELWLKYNNNAEMLWLPVNPETLEIGSPSANTTVNIARLGEVSVIQDPGLKTYSFSSILPASWGRYCSYTKDPWPRPWDIVKMLQRWKDSDMPCRFIVTGTPINTAVTIEDFNVTETAGDPGTLSYTFSLREYRFIKARKLGEKTVAGQKQVTVASGSARPSSKAAPTSYTVKPGDSLWKIAQAQIKDGSRYEEIATLNGIKSPYSLKTGQKLKLPAR